MKRYCNTCEKLTSHRQKGLRSPVDVCNKCDSTNSTYSLIKSDGTIHRAEKIKFIEWEGEELGSRGKQAHDFPKIGYSIVLDPQWAPNFTWLTTQITEIIELKEEYLKFKTQNSEYELFGPIKIYDDATGTPI
jgi:hypothetical protein